MKSQVWVGRTMIHSSCPRQTINVRVFGMLIQVYAFEIFIQQVVSPFVVAYFFLMIHFVVSPVSRMVPSRCSTFGMGCSSITSRWVEKSFVIHNDNPHSWKIELLAFRWNNILIGFTLLQPQVPYSHSNLIRRITCDEEKWVVRRDQMRCLTYV